MFGTSTAAPGGLFGSGPTAPGGLFGTQPTVSGGLFGASTPQPAQPAGGLFGSTSGSTTGGLFGFSTQNPQSSSGMFGSTAQPAATGGMFGSSQPQQSGGLFGPSSGLFSASQPQQRTGFGVAQPQQMGVGLFGTSSQPQQSLGGGFGSSQPAQTGGIFGASQPQATTGIFSSMQPQQTSSLLGSNGGFFGNQSQTMQPPQPQLLQVQQPQWPFPGAMSLLTRMDASDLRFGALPDGAAGPQDYLKSQKVPEPLHSELLQQQVEISRQGAKLDDMINISAVDLVRLLEQTAEMDQGVLHLRNVIARQSEQIRDLKENARTLKAVDTALHEARRLSNPARISVEKAVPSEFFQSLLQSLEESFLIYEQRSRELASMLANRSRAHTRPSMQSLLSILRQQHQAFQGIAAAVADLHDKMDELREQYRVSFVCLGFFFWFFAC
jgi:hypothetical protein